MKPSPYQTLSFDCYGTLIDWESGIVAALQPWLKRRGLLVEDDEILALHGKWEPKAEAGTYKTYREVLREVMRLMSEELGLILLPGEERILEDSLGRWPVFPDTVAALARLRQHHAVAILSNVDRDLIAETLAFNGMEVDWVLTAEDVRAYKPAQVFFETAKSRLNCPPDQWLHCGCSKYHDIGPASRLGIATAWINRRLGQSGDGATPSAEATPLLSFASLAELADALGA
jgi:2-haloacid dehalogenase